MPLLLPPQELTTEVGAFKGETGEDASLFVEHYSGSVLFIFFIGKLAIIEVKDWAAFVNTECHCSNVQILHAGIISAVVGEQIHIATMTMDITGQNDATAITPWLPSFFIAVLDYLFGIVDSWVHEFTRLAPAAI